VRIIAKVRKQDAIWWARQTTPDRYGKFTFAEPVAIKCRWTDKTQEFVDSRGEVAVSAALVMVDRVMSPGDRIQLGTLNLDNVDSPADPLDASTAYEVKRMERTPTLKNDDELLTVFL